MFTQTELLYPSVTYGVERAIIDEIRDTDFTVYDSIIDFFEDRNLSFATRLHVASKAFRKNSAMCTIALNVIKAAEYHGLKWVEKLGYHHQVIIKQLSIFYAGKMKTQEAFECVRIYKKKNYFLDKDRKGKKPSWELCLEGIIERLTSPVENGGSQPICASAFKQLDALYRLHQDIDGNGDYIIDLTVAEFKRFFKVFGNARVA